MNFKQDYYTPREIAEMMGVHYQTVMNWLRSGKLRGVKIGQIWKISKEALEELTQGA